MPTFDIPVVGAIDFPNGTGGYWEFGLPMRGGDVPVDINVEGDAFNKSLLNEIRIFISDATRFDEISRDVFRQEFAEKPEGTVGIYLSHHAEEFSEKELLRIFGVEDPDDLTIDHLLDALQLERIQQGTTMPKAYWVATYRSIRDPDALAAYAKLASAAHDSPAYQEALRLLGNGADRDMRIVPGVE